MLACLLTKTVYTIEVSQTANGSYIYFYVLLIVSVFVFPFGKLS